jgi:hypothetical protein
VIHRKSNDRGGGGSSSWATSSSFPAGHERTIDQQSGSNKDAYSDPTSVSSSAAGDEADQHRSSAERRIQTPYQPTDHHSSSSADGHLVGPSNRGAAATKTIGGRTSAPDPILTFFTLANVLVIVLYHSRSIHSVYSPLSADTVTE